MKGGPLRNLQPLVGGKISQRHRCITLHWRPPLTSVAVTAYPKRNTQQPRPRAQNPCSAIRLGSGAARSSTRLESCRFGETGLFGALLSAARQNCAPPAAIDLAIFPVLRSVKRPPILACVCAAKRPARTPCVAPAASANAKQQMRSAPRISLVRDPKRNARC